MLESPKQRMVFIRKVYGIWDGGTENLSLGRPNSGVDFPFDPEVARG